MEPSMDAKKAMRKFEKIETHVLKVNVDCHGCKKKVEKLLRKINGVYRVEIDQEEQLVVVYGSVNPDILIRKLAKFHKHAELWFPDEPVMGEINTNHNLLKSSSTAETMSGYKNSWNLQDYGDYHEYYRMSDFYKQSLDREWPSTSDYESLDQMRREMYSHPSALWL